MAVHYLEMKVILSSIQNVNLSKKNLANTGTLKNDALVEEKQRFLKNAHNDKT